MLYEILKIIFQISLKVFFRSIKVKNKHLIPKEGPMIVVSNHPNTFMDPLVVATQVQAQVYFLANSSIFSTPWASWLFKKLHMIPIQRKIDVPNDHIDNAQIFQQCYHFLAEGGTLLVFPEGTSVRERRLRKLKTGTARIALGAEASKDFSINLRIVTFGLNYTKPESFRSDVLVVVDEPIQVADFKELFLEDSFAAAQALTEKIREQLAEHIIITQDEEEDHLARQIEKIYKSRLSQEIQLSQEKKEQDYLISKGIVEAVRHFEEKEPERVAHFRPKIQTYLKNLHRLHLSDEVFDRKTKNKGLLWGSLQTAAYFILGFPFFLYGLINNYIPYIIPSKVAYQVVKASQVEEYMAPVMMVTGIFTFSFFYLIQTLLVHWIFGNGWITLAYFASLPLSGFFALFYANYLHTTRDKWRLFGLFYKRSDLVSTLVSQRKSIIQELEQAKADYLAYYEVES